MQRKPTPFTGGRMSLEDEEIYKMFEEDDVTLQLQTNGQESLTDTFQCYKKGYRQGKAEVKSKIKKVYILLEEMQKRTDSFFNYASDSANKNYKRGFFDGINNAKAKIKELIE